MPTQHGTTSATITWCNGVPQRKLPSLVPVCVGQYEFYGPTGHFFHTTFQTQLMSGSGAGYYGARPEDKVSKTSCAMAANIGEVQGHGDSAAWKAQKSNVLRIFEEFRVSTPQITGLYPSRWDDLTEEVAAACATLC